MSSSLSASSPAAASSADAHRQSAHTTSHHDESRRKVGTTAHVVAYFRSLETKKPADVRLINDPYAEHLGSREELESMREFSTSTIINREDFLVDRVDWMAVRSRKIDEETLKAIRSGIRQVVLLGAGLDTRAWRLQLQSYVTDDDKALLASVQWFEVDFPELFAFKLAVMKEQNADALVNYHAVTADLSLPDWVSKLATDGYDTTVPTYWLLEGFTGYLTTEEATALFQTLYDSTAVGSRVLATFVSPDRDGSLALSLHRFKPENPLAFCEQFGWQGKQEEITEIAKTFNHVPKTTWNGYKFVDIQKL